MLSTLLFLVACKKDVEPEVAAEPIDVIDPAMRCLNDSVSNKLSFQRRPLHHLAGQGLLKGNSVIDVPMNIR